MPSRKARAASRPAEATSREAVDALMRASKVVAAAIAHSLAVTGSKVTLQQLRVLVMVHDSGPLNMSAVADGLGVNPSNASRTCDRLVRGGLLDRRDASDDRRNVALTLTSSGTRLVAVMLNQRETIFSQVVDRMGGVERVELARGLAAFADAARDLSTDGVGLPDGDGHLLRWLS
jgi:DNA-binding MarR family transcriptional regulator